MPAPSQLPIVAYAVITIIPILFIAAYLYMYSSIGRAGLTGTDVGSQTGS